MMLFAHHVEPEHLPVLGIFACVGIWVGWRLMSLTLNYIRPSPEARGEQAEIRR